MGGKGGALHINRIQINQREKERRRSTHGKPATKEQ